MPESATDTSSRSADRSTSTRAAVPACSSAFVVSSLVHSTAAPITASGTCHSVSCAVIQCRTRLGAVGSAGTSMLADRLGRTAYSTASTATSSSVAPGTAAVATAHSARGSPPAAPVTAAPSPAIPAATSCQRRSTTPSL